MRQQRLLRASFKACELQKFLNPHPPPLPSLEGVKFGTLFTPHMMIIDYDNGKWGCPQILPFANFSLPPQVSCLHYGTTCFEGMKVYADISEIEKREKGGSDAVSRVRMFRPEKNVARLQRSMCRLSFPEFDAGEFLELLKQFVKTEKDHVPPVRGYSLYLRPSAIGTTPKIAADVSTSVRLFVLASPVGKYYSPPPGSDPAGIKTLQSVKLLVEEKHKRAWPGGTGDTKLGANYAGPMLIQKQAHERGYSQVLWLGPHNEVEEVGAMNFCVLWKTRRGSLELITAPLDGTVLPGITRDSVLELARTWGEFDVAERRYTIDELMDAIKEERVVECFGCGTAAVVLPISALNFRGVEYPLPAVCGETSVTARMLRSITEAQYGERPSEWSTLLEC